MLIKCMKTMFVAENTLIFKLAAKNRNVEITRALSRLPIWTEVSKVRLRRKEWLLFIFTPCPIWTHKTINDLHSVTIKSYLIFKCDIK